MVVILGGGLTGLVAAYEISKKGIPVTLIEKNSQLGGAMLPLSRKGYSLERYYHHCFVNDMHFLSLANELGMKKNIKWLPSSTGFYDGNFHELSGAMDLMFFKALGFRERDQLAKMMLMIKTTNPKDIRKLDRISAKEWIIKKSSPVIWDKFFEPMLSAKFGSDLDSISAAWFMERMRIRSNRGIRTEKLGYLDGGFYRIVEEMERRIISNGGKIAKKSNIKKIKFGKECVISTIPPLELIRIAKLPKGFAAKLKKLDYQGCVSVAIGLDKGITDFYWTNIIGKKLNFGAIVEHTNFVPSEKYSNEHIIYLASYPNFSSDIWKMTDNQIAKLYIKDLESVVGEKIHPIWFEVSKLRNAGLVYRKGIFEDIPAIETPVKGLFIGGMFNSYPERSMDASVRIGKECAIMAENYVSKLINEESVKKCSP